MFERSRYVREASDVGFRLTGLGEHHLAQKVFVPISIEGYAMPVTLVPVIVNCACMICDLAGSSDEQWRSAHCLSD